LNNENIFEKNLACLSRRNPDLASLIRACDKTTERYRFPESRSGEIVPAWTDDKGERPLHSMIDPRREANRFMDTAGNNGFVILLGLGGPYLCEAALERESCRCLLVIEYDITALAGLLFHLDYSKVLSALRFHLLADPSLEEVENCFAALYKPALHGGFITLPLRSRIVNNNIEFNGAVTAIENTVKKITNDYSVQAHFGMRWFSNIIRNLFRAEEYTPPLQSIRKAVVCAAGPSLDIAIPMIREQRKTPGSKDFFLIAVDTSYPALVSNGIKPDAVISMDCQHISYYHFMETLPEDTLLFLDISSPPLIASRAKAPRFFYGGHPLCLYLNSVWRKLPVLDTSGGNVTYAAVSLASYLGAESIELYGADFSYPLGLCYAKGSYIHGIFQRQQTRLKSLESLYSAFLYRVPLDKKERESMPKSRDRAWYYETASLRFYREYLETKNPAGLAELLSVESMGAPVSIRCKKNQSGNTAKKETGREASSRLSNKAADFLTAYREKIIQVLLPETVNNYPYNLNEEEYAVLNSILPCAAAVRRRIGESDSALQKTIHELKKYCLKEIDSICCQPQGL
jgi:uncharacterized Rossmann fold enzyme